MVAFEDVNIHDRHKVRRQVEQMPAWHKILQPRECALRPPEQLGVSVDQVQI